MCLAINMALKQHVPRMRLLGILKNTNRRELIRWEERAAIQRVQTQNTRPVREHEIARGFAEQLLGSLIHAADGTFPVGDDYGSREIVKDMFEARGLLAEVLGFGTDWNGRMLILRIVLNRLAFRPEKHA